MTGFERLKEICRVACHERKACQPGFEALLKADSVAEILAVWKYNWLDIYRSKFSDIMVEHIGDVYAELHEQFNASGVYVNEDTDKGLLIVSNPDGEVHIGGTGKAYVFTPSVVTTSDNAQVYSMAVGAKITLRGHSYGCIDDGIVEVRDFAEAKGNRGEFHTYNAARVHVTDGMVTDHGHRMIAAYGKCKVYSDATRNIVLDEPSRQFPLLEYVSK